MEGDVKEWQVDDYVVEEETLEDSTLNAQVSVHDLDGTFDYKTMRVKGESKGRLFMC